MTTRLSVLIGTLVVGVFALAWSIKAATHAPVHRNEARPDVVIAETLERERPAAQPREAEPRRARAASPVAATVADRAAAAATGTETETDSETDADGDTVEPQAPPSDEEFRSELSAFGENLRHIIFGDEEGKEAADRLREVLHRAGPERLNQLMDRFSDDAEEMGARVVIAHALAQSNDPRAIAKLAAHLRDPEAGMMVQRFASHALAFSDADGVETILLEVATHTAERGTRANAAFGLARRGDDEGLRLYFVATDEAFAAGDPAALQYLGGLRLLGDKVLPGVRERLTTYKNEQALLVLIGGVKAACDKESVPILEGLAYDAAQPVSIQKAAQGALKVLRSTD